MPATFQISEEVRDVLARSCITETTVTLPEQLDRKLYEAVNKVLSGAGGTWDKRAKCHVFSRSPRVLLAEAIETGQATNEQQRLQAFYTPYPLALSMTYHADLSPGLLVLEPSAGKGSLANVAARKVGRYNIQCYDIDPEAIAYLTRDGFFAEQRDFLTVIPYADCLYDRVLMNPPFSRWQDIQHVIHAWRFLAPDGLLVTIIGAMAGERRYSMDRMFKAFLEGKEVDQLHNELLPEDMFKESGTCVRTRLLVLRKESV